MSWPKDATGFVVLPQRWVVERSLGWIMHARRLVRDYERLPQHSEALTTWAAITLVARRLTQPPRQAVETVPTSGNTCPAMPSLPRSVTVSAPSHAPASTD